MIQNKVMGADRIRMECRSAAGGTRFRQAEHRQSGGRKQTGKAVPLYRQAECFSDAEAAPQSVLWFAIIPPAIGVGASIPH